MRSKLSAFLFSLFCFDVVAMEASDRSARKTMSTFTVVSSLNVPRFMGAWYEIAKFPSRFQKECTRYTRLQYSLNANGRIRLSSRCLFANGEVGETIGEARQLGAATSPRLEVRFIPTWLSFLPGAWRHYWVIDLDEEYRLAVVSEPNREYLWILSRTPKVEKKKYTELLVRLKNKGFDIGKLELTTQAN